MLSQVISLAVQSELGQSFLLVSDDLPKTHTVHEECVCGAGGQAGPRC